MATVLQWQKLYALQTHPQFNRFANSVFTYTKSVQNVLCIFISKRLLFESVREHYSEQKVDECSPIPWRWLNQEPFWIDELIRVWDCWARRWHPFMYMYINTLTSLLVLILIHWQRGSDIKLKGEQLSSSAECRIRILRPNHQQTECPLTKRLSYRGSS